MDYFKTLMLEWRVIRLKSKWRCYFVKVSNVSENSKYSWKSRTRSFGTCSDALSWWDGTGSSNVVGYSSCSLLWWTRATSTCLCCACLWSVFDNINSSSELEAVILHSWSSFCGGCGFARAWLCLINENILSVWVGKHGTSYASLSVHLWSCDSCTATNWSNWSRAVVSKVRASKIAKAKWVVNTAWSRNSWGSAVCLSNFCKVIIEQGFISKWILLEFFLEQALKASALGSSLRGGCEQSECEQNWFHLSRRVT